MGDGVLAGVRVDEAWEPNGQSVSAMNDIDADDAHAVPRSRVRRPARSARGGRAELPAGREADAARQRRVGRRAQARQRRARHRRRSARSRRTASSPPTARSTRSTCIIYGTGFQASKFLTPMTVTRSRRRRPARAVGRRRARVPRRHDPGVPEPVLPLRAEHQHRHQRQHRLLLRVRRALHPRLLGAAARERIARALEVRKDVHDEFNERVDAENRAHGVGLVRREQLVQERARPRRAELAVHAARVLAAHAATPTPTTTSSRERASGGGYPAE